MNALPLLFKGRAVISGKLRVLTGLHIGAGKDRVEIGGIDNPIVRDPLTGQPYVPGSSIKGKLRFMLEWAFGKVRTDSNPWGFNGKVDTGQTLERDDQVLRIFGASGGASSWAGGPTRLLVRDSHLDPDWLADIRKRGIDVVEEKTEVSIDRIAGKAMDGRLRTSERVAAGAVFNLGMVFRLYDTGDGGACDRACLNWTLAGLGLIEQDALGGSGSRGYGRVSFEDLVVTLPDGRTEPLEGRHRLNRFPVDAAPAIVSF